jgi:hypothetical protein
MFSSRAHCAKRLRCEVLKERSLETLLLSQPVWSILMVLLLLAIKIALDLNVQIAWILRVAFHTESTSDFLPLVHDERFIEVENRLLPICTIKA